jgi:hypothetical protein
MNHREPGNMDHIGVMDADMSVLAISSDLKPLTD